MDTYNPNTTASETQSENRAEKHNRSGRIAGGLFIVAIGLVFLAQKAGADFPDWLLSIESLLIALGVYIGFRHSFKGLGWTVPILIGGFMLIDDFYPDYDLSEFTWPLILIGFGLFIMFRPHRKRENWRSGGHRHAFVDDSTEDFLDSTVIFGGVKKNIISKNFRGGDTVTVFGGTEINLMQADIAGPVVLDLTQVFGGTKLIVPPHWRVQTNDLVAILGGVDDKRPLTGQSASEETNKVLTLKGTCLLGGIDIRSY